MNSAVNIWIVASPVLAPRQYRKHRTGHGTLQISPLDVEEIALAEAHRVLNPISLVHGLGLFRNVSEDFIFELR